MGLIDLVHAEVPEQRLIARVVHPRDGPRHIEVMLGHLAHHEVVLVVAGHRGDDSGPVGSGLREVLALAAIACEHDRADLVRDLLGPHAILLQEHQLVAGGDEFLGQVVADLATAHDDHVHQCWSSDHERLAVAVCEEARATSCGPG